MSLAFMGALALMAVFAASFTGGRWFIYNLSDYVVNFFRLSISALSRGVAARAALRKDAPPAGEGQQAARRKALPILRGVVLALPVLAILGSLLAAADPVFSRWLQQALAFLRIENLPEYIFRAIYILIIAYGLTGVYLHAALASRDERVLGQEKAWLKPFLGSTEAAIILGSVVVLFAVFVIIQFQYFFGGQSNITAQGFTYSEYARRGFGELVAVALISLGLLLGLSAVTRRETNVERRIFTILGTALVALVIVILVSAFQRVTLYESAYGFSRLRTYTHIFIIWLGILLAATLVLELTSRLNAFALVAVIAVAGFVATLSILNVDALIVRQNVLLAQSGSELDAAYLASLSDDAVPAMGAAFQNAPAGSTLKEGLGAALVCHSDVYSPNLKRDSHLPWQAFLLSRENARKVMAGIEPDLASYAFSTSEVTGSTVLVGTHTYSCFGSHTGD